MTDCCHSPATDQRKRPIIIWLNTDGESMLRGHVCGTCLAVYAPESAPRPRPATERLPDDLGDP